MDGSTRSWWKKLKMEVNARNIFGRLQMPRPGEGASRRLGGEAELERTVEYVATTDTCILR
jgi:hypothetical protein